MITNKIVKLDTLFVIVKKYNGKTYYYGNGGETGTQYKSNSKYTNARYAHIYYSEEKAKQECDILNSIRKKLKYRVEKASKHFLSSFSFNINPSITQVALVNAGVSVQDFKMCRAALVDTKKQLEGILKTVQDEIIKTKKRQAQIPQQMRQKIAEIEHQHKNEIDKNAEQLTQLNNLQNSLQNFDWNSLEEYRTVEDSTFKVLYGHGDKDGNS